VRITVNAVSEANVYKMKSSLKSWILKYGIFSISSLILMKDYFSLGPHLDSSFFLIMSCKGFTVSETFGTNLHTKLIFPRKDCIDFLLYGKEIFDMASLLYGSIITPNLDTTKI
jgi:hypothetical protein